MRITTEDLANGKALLHRERNTQTHEALHDLEDWSASWAGELIAAAERLAALEAKCEGLEEHNIELQKQCSSLADQLAAFTSDSNIGKQYGEPCDQGDKEAPPCANSPSSPEPGAEGKTE